MTGKETKRNVTEGMEISKFESDWSGKDIIHNLISIASLIGLRECLHFNVSEACWFNHVSLKEETQTYFIHKLMNSNNVTHKFKEKKNRLLNSLLGFCTHEYLTLYLDLLTSFYL